MFITFFDMHIVIPSADVEFGVNVCTTEVCDEIRDKGKGVLVTDGIIVDMSIVLNRA